MTPSMLVTPSMNRTDFLSVMVWTKAVIPGTGQSLCGAEVTKGHPSSKDCRKTPQAWETRPDWGPPLPAPVFSDTLGKDYCQGRANHWKANQVPQAVHQPPKQPPAQFVSTWEEAAKLSLCCPGPVVRDLCTRRSLRVTLHVPTQSPARVHQHNNCEKKTVTVTPIGGGIWPVVR